MPSALENKLTALALKIPEDQRDADLRALLRSYSALDAARQLATRGGAKADAVTRERVWLLVLEAQADSLDGVFISGPPIMLKWAFGETEAAESERLAARRGLAMPSMAATASFMLERATAPRGVVHAAALLLAVAVPLSHSTESRQEAREIAEAVLSELSRHDAAAIDAALQAVTVLDGPGPTFLTTAHLCWLAEQVSCKAWHHLWCAHEGEAAAQAEPYERMLRACRRMVKLLPNALEGHGKLAEALLADPGSQPLKDVHAAAAAGVAEARRQGAPYAEALLQYHVAATILLGVHGPTFTMKQLQPEIDAAKRAEAACEPWLLPHLRNKLRINQGRHIIEQLDKKLKKMGGTLQPDTPLPAMLVARSNDPTPAREVTRQPLADVKEKLMRKECCAACSSFSNHLRACPCYRAWYCGEECQREHFKEHKKICTAVRKATASKINV